jgi:HSP20 family protein
MVAVPARFWRASVRSCALPGKGGSTMLTRFSDYGFPRFGLRGLSDGFPLEDLRREMDRLLFDFESAAPEHSVGFPAFSVEDRGAVLTLRADVPGLGDKDLGLTVTATSVTVRGERKVEAPEGYATHRSERRGFRFARTFELGTKIDPEKVQATLTNGVLTVTLPKSAEAQPKQIAVKAS